MLVSIGFSIELEKCIKLLYAYMLIRPFIAHEKAICLMALHFPRIATAEKLALYCMEREALYCLAYGN